MGGKVVTPSTLCLEGCQGHVSCQECKLCSYTSLSGSCYVTWCKSSAFDPHVLQLADQCSALASQSLRILVHARCGYTHSYPSTLWGGDSFHLAIKSHFVSVSLSLCLLLISSWINSGFFSENLLGQINIKIYILLISLNNIFIWQIAKQAMA